MMRLDVREIGNLFDVAAAAATQFGDRDFLIVGRRSETISFQGLVLAAEKFSRVLTRMGVRPGDRVGLSMTNRVDWAVAAYGVARCGAVLVAINTRLSAREITHMLALTGAGVWIIEDVFLGKIQASDLIAPVLNALADRAASRPAVLVWSESGARYPGTSTWQDEMAGIDPNTPLAPAADLVAESGRHGHPELARVAVILATSGTTGSPKGVMLGHSGLIKLAAAVAQRQDLSPSERFYSIGPFFHCSGYMHGLLVNLIAGSTYFSTPQFNIEETWDVLTSEEVTAYHGFVGVLKGLPALPKFDRSKLKSFDRAWYSAPAAEMADLEEKLGTKMCEVYGLTETGGNVAICTADDPVDMRHDSDGRPHDGLDVKIVDPVTGVCLSEGVPGEICVRGFNVMRGYFADAEATAKTVNSEGWLSTGDQGVLLPGGYLKFLSRLKDVIRVGGENLSPIEVEEVLIEHPAVTEAAVVAAPHERLTEVPVAFVIVKDAQNPTEAELRAFCRERLANFKVPTRILIVPDFPRTGATNRIQKAKLREMLMDKRNA